jgi:prepilin-type N-terminal cleavage/methylation domain-containing protein
VVLTARGYSLIEVVVALVVVQVGFLAAFATLTLAERQLTRAELVHQVSQSAAELGDSLVAAGGSARGERRFEWGRIEWVPGGLAARDGQERILLEWRFPISGSSP